MALGEFLMNNCALMLRKIPYILLYRPPLLENLAPTVGQILALPLLSRHNCVDNDELSKCIYKISK